MLGKLEGKEIEDLLCNQVIGRIGCAANGLVYVVPVTYAYDGKDIYAVSNEGLKLEIMRKNPQVCFEVDNMRDMSNWQSVIAWGKFEELTNEVQRKQAFDTLVSRSRLISSVVTHHSPTWPFVSNDFQAFKGIAFRIRLNEKTGRFENQVAAPQIKG